MTNQPIDTIEEAQPCPFCKSADPRTGRKLNEDCFVFCQECHCEGPPKETREEAISAWNRRALIPAVREQIGRGERGAENPCEALRGLPIDDLPVALNYWGCMDYEAGCKMAQEILLKWSREIEVKFVSGEPQPAPDDRLAPKPNWHCMKCKQDVYIRNNWNTCSNCRAEGFLTAIKPQASGEGSRG